MKAIVCPEYGPPEVLELRDVEKPIPRGDEVLVRVRATTVGPADCAFRQGDPLIARLYSGIRRPKSPVLGGSLAGEVEAVGGEVTRFKEGDRVFGLSPKGFGTHAEYTCLPEEGLLATTADGMTDEDAVSILEALTALTFLRDVAQVQAGQRVLINGASGSVGGFAVQLARHFGAHVTGVCSTANVPLVRSLGADDVIDHTAEDFTRDGQRYDVIFDAVGKRSFADCRSSLTPEGSYLSTVPSLGIVAAMAWTSLRGGRKARFATTGLMQKRENITFIAELFGSGQLNPVIDRRYPLAEAAEAHRYVETGHKKGSVVITP